MTNLLFISRDPGGTNQLVALFDLLSGEGDEAETRALYQHFGLLSRPNVTILAKDFAAGIWQQNGIEPLAWPDVTAQEDIAAAIKIFNPDHIITSTGHVDDRTEQMVWRVASGLALKTTAFLDSDDNLALRFTDDDGGAVFPDYISLIDEASTPSLRALGFLQENIIISGDLYQNFIRSKPVGAGKEAILSQWGVQQGEYVILFASDYIKEMQAIGVAFDITEFDCLDCLIEILRINEALEIVKGHMGPYRLVIRPHPKDSLGKYDDYPTKSTQNITIIIDQTGASRDAIGASDLVASFGSSLLGEARILGFDALPLGPLVKRYGV